MSFFGFSTLQAQCPTSDVYIGDVQDLELYQANYPDCTELNVNLTIFIRNPDLNSIPPPFRDISELSKIERINGILTIAGSLEIDPGGDLQYYASIYMPNLTYVHKLVLADTRGGLGGLFTNISEIDILKVTDNYFMTELPVTEEPIKINESLIIEDNGRLRSIGNLMLTDSMKEVIIVENELSGEPLMILDDLKYVENLHLDATTIESIDSEVFVENELVLTNNYSLIDISGIAVGNSLDLSLIHI